MTAMSIPLMQHQQSAVDFTLANGGIAAIHHDPGCGKTLTALTIYSRLKEKEQDLKLLVVCPISLIHGAWAKEIEKFTDHLWFDLHSGKCKNLYSLNDDIFIINFEYLISVTKFEELKAFMRTKRWMVAVDESSKMKNHAGVITFRLNGGHKDKKYHEGIRDLCKYRIELSGTPAPNIEWEYWPQMFFLNPSILGDNFYRFRNRFFNLQRGREIVPGAVMNKAALREMFNNGYKYEFDTKMRETFFSSLKPWCHVAKAKDCLDLPEAVDEYRIFDMEGDQARVYKEMKTEYIAEINSEIENSNKMPVIIDGKEYGESSAMRSVIVANIILTKMMKLRQITSGFAIDNTGVTRAISLKVSEKLKILLDIVEEIGNEQLIIWCQFKWEITQIVSALKSIHGVSELHGGIKTEDRIAHIDNFLSGRNRFLVAHPDSAAHGLTFVNCRYAAYFSLSYSFEEYEQSRKRIHRYGQSRSCVYFHIMASNSVDEEVLAVCQKKATRQEVAERFLKI